MEQDERAVADPSEAPVTVLAGKVAGAEEGVSEANGSVRVPASEGAKNQDLEEPSPESDDEVAAASGGVEGEDRGAFDYPSAAHFELRDEVPVLGAPLSSSALAPVAGAQEDVPAMADGDQGAAPGDDKKMERACSAPAGATVAIAHASPPDSYRRLPSRSRKQHSPKRFVDAAGDPPRSESSDSADSDGAESSSSSSSSSPDRRPPSRGRKQPRPDHFNPEEAEATVRAKARRSGIALDRFLTSLVLGSSASDSEWARNVTAGNTAPRASGSGTPAAMPSLPAGRGPRSAASEPYSAARSPPRRRRRHRGVLRASPTGEGDRAHSPPSRRLSCVQFYIVCQRSEPDPSGEKKDK